VAEFGYAGEILKVNLSDGNTTKLSTADYADRFLGGRGIAAKLYWDMVPPETKAFDPANCLIYITGPVAGFSGLAGCRWQICGKSPAGEPEAFSYANLGGKWGSALKYAGYDGLVVQGKSDKPVYLFIHDDTVEIRDASFLWGESAFDVSDSLRAELGEGVSVLTIGPAAENLVPFATMLADEGSSGSGGLGAVMGSKMLKAIVVVGNKTPRAADPERLQQLGQQLAVRIKQMRKATNMPAPGVVPGITRTQFCYGCGVGCYRQSYIGEKGRRFKSFCQATDVYKEPAMKYFGEWNDVQLLAVRLCDGYGLDTAVMQGLIEWLIACYREGLLRDEDTGLPLSKAGSPEFIEALTQKITFREGFGEILARGTIEAAESVGERSQELIGESVATRASETKDYDPRLLITTALFYATEPRRPIHQLHETLTPMLLWLNWVKGEKDAFFSSEDYRNTAARFWGSAIAADLSTYEGKPLAAKKIQDRTYAKESLILCDLRWPIMWANYPEEHVGDPTLESQIFSAITGKEVDEAGLNKIGERIFNLQRAILLRQGWGGRKGDRLLDYLHQKPLREGELFYNLDCLAPGKDGEVISRKGAVVDREEFEKMKSEYYERRGWDVESGLPTRAKLEELQLNDVAGDLEGRGLLK
jgi:aldehyde:ferredoxin oxidoreductase